MAYPASTVQLSVGLERVDISALQLKQRAQTLRNEATATPIARERLISFMAVISNAIDLWSEAGALPGMAQYARDQKSDQNLDVIAEFQTMVNEATSLRDWIFDNFPKDTASGAWLVSTYANDGDDTPLEFSVAQLAGFVTRADALILTID